MTYKKTIEVKLSALVLDGDWKRDLDKDTVDRLADAMADGKPIVPIAIRSDKQLHWGRHRVAAAMQAGLKTIRAEVLDFPDQAAAEIASIGENLNRRQITTAERAASIARLKVLYEAAHPNKANGKAQAEGMKAASRKAVRGAARHEVSAKPADSFSSDLAKVTGMSERTVREYAQIGSALTPEQVAELEAAEVPHKEILAVAAAPPEERPAVVAAALGKAPPIDMMGLELREPYAGAARVICEALDDAEKALKQAQGKLTGLLKALEDAPTYHRQRYEAQVAQWHRSAHSLAAEIRAARPTRLCPYCKGVERAQKYCPACKGTAIVAGVGDCPNALLVTGDEAMISVDGKLTKLAELRR